MSVNITFDGYCYDESSVIGDSTIYYQGYFLKIAAGSSSSTWNTVKTLEHASGYYNINLGSGDWLGPAGSAAAGDIVVIAFWKGGPDRTADCNVLTQWGAFEITLDGSDSYSNDVQIKDNIVPDLSWSTDIPVYAYVDTVYNVVNTSDDEHSWLFGTTTMYHWYIRHGQTILGPNFISSTDIYWGDGQSNLNLPYTSGYSHSYDAAGTYEITVEVFDDCTASTSGTVPFNIYWHEPVPNITMTPSDPDPNEPVSFQYSGTDVDDRITSIEWVIEDDGAYGTTNTTTSGSRDVTIQHSAGTGTDWYGQSGISGAFTNPGSHNVSIVIHWNDGFNDQTMIYDEDFTQNRFSGPTVDFIQAPASVDFGNNVVFINSTTDTDRIGLGLPDHEQYEWTWTDDGVDEVVSNQAFGYQLDRTPTSTDCEVQLCADWSDGWDTMQTCVTKSVVFDTTVTVTEEDCYYNINVIGTSDDGTVTGYGWTVSSGASDSGPWTEIWSSPIGMEQQEKSIGFTSFGWFKIDGFVYGNGATTSDDEIIQITEVCPDIEDCSSVHNIWNGTGTLDIGSDWTHTGHGTESSTAVYMGTNGMLATGSAANDVITFTRSADFNINNFDFLSMWVNIKSWQARADVRVKLYSTNDPTNTRELDLSNYLTLSDIDEWQRVMIPLKRFKISPNKTQVGWPTYVNRVDFTFEGANNFWLDDVSLIAAEIITSPICTPDMETTQLNTTVSHSSNITPITCPTPFPRPINI